MYYYNIYKQLFAYGTAAIFFCLSLIVLTVDAAIISSSVTDDHKSMPCLVDACTSTYKQSVNEIRSHGPSAIVDHCLLLNSYRLCLNDTFRHCLAQLDFHSSTTTAVQRWHTFECDDRLMITSSSSTGTVQHQQQFGQQNSAAIEPTKCAIKMMTDLEDDEGEADKEGHGFDLKDEYYYSDEEEINHIHGSDEPNKLHKMEKRPIFCAIFGQLHLRPFHASSLSQIGQCSFVGARPLIDNPFFLIQITVSNLFINRNGQQHNLTKIFGITKIAVIIRPKTGCFVGDRKLYLADTGDPNDVLSATFVDGTSNSGTDQFGKRAVEIEKQQRTKASVKISLNHINTEILITSIGNRFFNIFVRLGMPKIQKRFRTSLCSQSCQNGVQMVEHSSAPLNFSQEIEELCSPLLDQRTAKESAVPPNANRNNWISAICAQELANASKMKEYFPMALWVDALFDAAEQLEESDHDLFNNISRKMSRQNEDDDDDRSHFIPSEQLPNKKLITDHNGIGAKKFEWHSPSVPKASESKAIGKPSYQMSSYAFVAHLFLSFIFLFFVCDIIL